MSGAGVASVTREDVARGVRELGLAGLPVCVHSSLRSFGRVEGGAEAVVDGLLAADCTVLVPTFSSDYLIVPPDDMRPARNGWDDDRDHTAPGASRIYTPDANDIEADMGAIPRAILRRSGRQRGNNPLDSFAALGPLAGTLISGQGPLDVYAPFRALREHDGWVVLMGVGLTRMTLLHEAERVAGRSLFLRWANGPDGQPIYVETGSCSEGFDAFEPFIAPLAREVRVGSSRWRAFPVTATIEAAAAAIRANPMLTRCGDPRCERCPDATQGGPIRPGI